MTPYSRDHGPQSYQHFWDSPEWRAEMMRDLTAQGISALRADQLVDKAVKRFREEHARDEASEGERRGS